METSSKQESLSRKLPKQKLTEPSDEELINSTSENVPWFSFENKVLKCKVLSVYDGDTITIAFKHDGNIVKKKCRLLGIDTPEIRTKNKKEKEKGYEAREFMSNLIEGKIVYVKCGPWSKYGDILGKVFLTKEELDKEAPCVNDVMVTKGLAHKYFGGTKEKWNF